MNKNILYTLLAMLTLLSACRKTSNGGETASGESNDSIRLEVKYAKGFALKYVQGGVLLDITDPEGKGDKTFRYALMQRGKKHNQADVEGYEVIETPIAGTICMTTPQLSYFIKLQALDKVVGITSTQYLKNEQVKKAIDEGKIGRIGMDGDFDTELVVALNPQVILVSPTKRGGYESIKNLNIPLLSFYAYKELDPLGQSEWLKVVGILTGKETEAQRLFEGIEQRYNELKKLTAEVKHRPTVMTGELRSGTWHVLGGRNYQVKQLTDAGANYFMPERNETGGVDLDFEAVYARGEKADFWRMMHSKGDEVTYAYIQSIDPRYADFKAFKERKIFNIDQRKRPFYEEVPVAPEVVLADLIKIFHPELLPDHKPVYYELLTK